MPSLLHEVLVDLFQTRPLLVAELLEQLRIIGPHHDLNAATVSSTLSTLAPTEYRADQIVRLAGALDLDVIVEIQLRIDAEKRRVWPVYLTVQHARDSRPVLLLVLTLDSGTARWARQPIEIGPGSILCPVVMGPEEIPAIDDPARAAEVPELAVLSALAHAHGARGTEIAWTAIEAARHLDEDRARLYVDLVWQALPTAARLILEAHMNTNWEPQNPIFKRLRAEGREDGRAEGEREMVRRLLEIRFGALTDEHLTRLQEATEPQLLRWAERLLSAPDLEAVFSAE